LSRLAAGAALCGCLVACQSQDRTGIPPLVSDSVAGVAEFQFYQDKLILVSGMVNGYQSRLALASGTSPTVISRQLAKRIGLAAGVADTVRGSAGAVNSERIGGVELELAGWELSGIDVQVVDLSAFNKASGAGVDAVVGVDLFSRAVVTIDFPAELILIEDPLDCSHGAENGSRMQWTRDGWVVDAVSVEGCGPRKFVLETGDSEAIALFIGEGEVWAGLRRDGRTLEQSSAVGVGGQQTTYRAVFKIVDIAGMAILEVPGTFREPPGSLVDARISGRLGPSLFKGVRITLDGPHERFVAEPRVQ